LALIEMQIDHLKEPELFRIVIEGNLVILQEKDRLRISKDAVGFDFFETFFDNGPNVNSSYTPMLRFVLVDGNKRLFIVERFCFEAGEEGWIFLSGPSRLKGLVRKYLPHLGQDSFYALRP
jgi:hypothetical protein